MYITLIICGKYVDPHRMYQWKISQRHNSLVNWLTFVEMRLIDKY